MFEFTKRAKRVVNDYAQQEAKRLGHDIIGPEHILLGLLREEDSVAIRILKNLNVNLSELKKEVERRCESGSNTLLIDISNSDRYQKVIEASREEAKKFKHNYVGTEHILLALLRDNNNIAGAALGGFSINYSVIKGEIHRILGVSQPSSSTSTSRTEKQKTPTLDEFARDLTELARQGKLDPVIGRDDEIERVVQILARKRKNNPILIGESGVGKTAIVEGLASQIVKKTIPDLLFEKRVLALDLASLVAGTKYRGEFEERLKKIMREIVNSPDVIIFIDELHTLIGAGAAEGAIDAANMLKPALARGEMQCIGATTLQEYKKYIERDSALERRFQSVKVAEPSEEDTLLILSGLKDSYEAHHKVEYSEEAVKLCVRLSGRYITDRYFPDKAIDVMDEAGSRARLKNSIRPPELKKLEVEIQKLSKKKDELVKGQEYERAAAIRDEVKRKKEELERQLKAWRDKSSEYKVTIEEDDILAVISSWTGIPLEKLEETEAQKLLQMEEELKQRIVGQEEAVEKVCRAVRRSRTGFKSMKRPSGSFIFLGPTGVGKTELARALAEFLFGSEDKLYRMDMSEYMEPHSVSKMIGSPPGYVGYDEGGQLTEYVRRNPYSVILFDEMEKAHRDVFNILLQILEEGTLTDTLGNKVDFKDTIIIMTSNVGAREMQKHGKLGFEDAEGEKLKSRHELVADQLKRQFNPEFLNRVDEIIYFSSLGDSEIREIIEIMVKEINVRIMEQDLRIVLSKKAYDYIAEIGYDPKFGARPLRRALQREIEDWLAVEVLKGDLKGPAEVHIDYKRGKLKYTTKSIPSIADATGEVDVSDEDSNRENGSDNGKTDLELSGTN